MKQADAEAMQAQANILNDKKEELILPTGRKVHIGWIRPDTQDKIDELVVEHNARAKKYDEKDEKSANKLNKETRKHFAKFAAAVLINNYFGLKLWWWAKWRIIHHFWNLSGDDYLAIAAESKKKAAEASYSLAMALTMDMTTLTTTMTKKEVEEYRAELELVREHQSLKNSQD